MAPKFKTNILPSWIGQWDVAIAGGAMFDLITTENTGLYAYMPATLRLSKAVRVKANGGWLWDRIANHHFSQLRGRHRLAHARQCLDLTAEFFGQFGTADTAPEIESRFQEAELLRDGLAQLDTRGVDAGGRAVATPLTA